MIVQNPKHKTLYQQSGALFPARRYLYGMSTSLSTLRYLIDEYKPQFDTKTKWEIAKGKVLTRDPTFWKNHPYGPILIAKKDDWKLDMVVDFYTEDSRVATPGYGEEYSPAELWEGVSNTNDRMSKLFDRNVVTPADAREAMYDDIQEARLAYVTCSKGLYQRLKSFQPSAKTVLDISAFGDRMIAALANKLEYTGVDPDPSLVEGMSKLRRDLSSLTNIKPQLYTLPLESFWSSTDFDIITLSMPPFDMEKYAGGERQTHRVYHNFHGWMNGFVRETLMRARDFTKVGSILAFSVLDRPVDGDKPTIFYTEAMILLAEDLGFEFIEIFGFPKRTPWWIFRRREKISRVSKFLEFYPELAPISIYDNNTPLLEYMRRCVQKYIIGSLLSMPELKDHTKHLEKYLGHYLMAKGSSKDGFQDPLFFEDDSVKEVEVVGKIKIGEKSVPFQTSDSAFYLETFGNTVNELVNNLYSAAQRYLYWIMTTSGYIVASKRLSFIADADQKNFVSLVVEKRYAHSVIGFIRRYVPFGPGIPDTKGVMQSSIEVRDYDGATLSLWKTQRPYDSARWKAPSDQGMSDLRYDTVGAFGNHYTRPQGRMEVMLKIVGEEIIDLFATPFNTNTPRFCSLYPDVDAPGGSLGSFFDIKGWGSLGTSSFMANPPDFPEFVKNVMDIISDAMNNHKLTFFVSTVLWEDTDSKYLNRIREGDDPNFVKSGNFILDYCWDKKLIRPEFLKAVYILDKQKYPSLNPMTSKTSIREGSESVGVILSSKDRWTKDDSLVEALGDSVMFD